MRKRRLGAIAGIALAGLALSACSGGAEGSGGDAEHVLRVAFNQNIDHPQAQALEELSKKLSEQTDGKYALQVYPDETLGDQASTIEQVQSGTIDFAIVAGSLLENFVDDFSVVNLPYVWDSPEQQMQVLNDTSIMGDLYDELGDSDLRVMTAYHGGVRNVYSSVGPVKEPADLAGQKIRVIESDTNVSMMKLMGGIGTPMAQGEVYTAIQSGVLDGAENNELIYSSLSHDEIAPYYSYTKHLMMPDYLLISPKVWDAMDADTQEVFTTLLQESVDTELKLFAEATEKAKADAEEAGAEFNDADVDAFRDAVQPLVDKSISNDRTQAIYDAITDSRG
ncbi:TRAP transporter substrate-binding protein [Paramicrobacterium chengjingii]|uniref:TRAP transporter substrate-binding protein n=1 Tax=Paramicrobacterium chengjingii TaxID=2769067 RepID=UPI00141EE6B5|nr:TRAP transporter substrate-binding protein [Microbacterium chengjingii]